VRHRWKKSAAQSREQGALIALAAHDAPRRPRASARHWRHIGVLFATVVDTFSNPYQMGTPTEARMDKKALIEELRVRLAHELAEARRVATDTAAAANHPEARPENDKDTRKIELSYLAAGQAARAYELEAAVALLATLPVVAVTAEDPLKAGALVELDVDGKAQRVLLSPAGGGQRLATEDGEVSVVTPQSPLGRGLLGKRVGDSFELAVAGQVREVEILGVE
jgi:transcription elongation GreA/GreB family factor